MAASPESMFHRRLCLHNVALGVLTDPTLNKVFNSFALPRTSPVNMITESIAPEGMSPRSTKSSTAGVWHKRAWSQFPLRPRLQTFFLGLPARKPCWAPCCPALTPGPPSPGPLHVLFLFFHKYPSNVHSHGDSCWSSYLKLQMLCLYTTLFFSLPLLCWFS